MAAKTRPETNIYYLVATLLGVALLGYSYTRYLVYVLPIIVFIAALLLRCVTFNVNKVTLPFLFILLASLPTAYNYDFNSFKKIVFIAAYTSIFLFVDFSRVRINFHYFGAVLIAVFLLLMVTGGLKHESDVTTYSIMDSKSEFESSLAFPFALLACYYILSSRWKLSILYTFLVFLALKRIAIIAIMVTFIARFIPKKLRVIFINPYVIISLSLFITYLTIYFAHGGFDSFIKATFHKAPNDFTKGREQLWSDALTALHYQFSHFIFYGVGIGKVITALQGVYHADRVLLHNDVLSLLLEYGLIIFTLFMAIHLSQNTFEQRIMALALLVTLFTDNVIIYQHVMITYMLVQSQFAKKKRHRSVAHAPAPE